MSPWGMLGSVLPAHRTFRGHAMFQQLLKSEGKKAAFRLKNGEGNGTPLQYSCLENPMDGGAW